MHDGLTVLASEKTQNLIPQDKHKIVCQQRRNREKNQRIQSILEAAKKVFSTKGYLKTTMDEIAMEAEITKPTIYLYFKAKDDLFFSLMLPLIDDIRKQLEQAEEYLAAGIINDGHSLIRAIFRAFYHGYISSPETFRIIQLFQQQGLMSELKPEIRTTLNDQGRVNVALGRRLFSRGMELGLIKKVNVYELSDVIWGLTVGVIQLEDIKSDDRKGHKLKENTLLLAERLIAEALSLKEPPSQECSTK
jgi:TetR/AcrR family transcriptional regulator